VQVTVHIIGIFSPQDSELLQERQLKEDLLQQTEVVSKFQEKERKSSVNHTVYHNIYIQSAKEVCGSGRSKLSAFTVLTPLLFCNG
jgi:hypothetical protein